MALSMAPLARPAAEAAGKQFEMTAPSAWANPLAKRNPLCLRVRSDTEVNLTRLDSALDYFIL
jgi:hypothetical protein